MDATIEKRHALKLAGLLVVTLSGLGLTGCGPTEEDDPKQTIDAGTDTGMAESDTTMADGTSPDAGDTGMTDTGGNEELCGADLAKAAIDPVDGTSEATVNSTPEDPGYTTTVELPWGSAADDAPYAYLRLLEGTSVPLKDAEALTDENWDMAMRGAQIRLNGGDSGPGGVEAAAIDGKAFADVTPDDVPDSLRQDTLAKQCAQASSAGSLLDTAIGQWWTDSSSAQSPSPADKTYVIKRVDGDMIKLRIQKADVSGESATLTLRWAALDQGPSCDVQQARNDAINPITSVSDGVVSSSGGILSVDASAGGMRGAASEPYVYVDLDKTNKVAIGDEAAFTDMTWDIALERVVVRVNGGDSGQGGVTVAERSAETLDDVSMVPDAQFFKTDDFVDDMTCEVSTDQIGNPKTAIGNWYEYDVNAHGVAPIDSVYVVKTTEGDHYKIEFRSYDDGNYKIAWAKM